MKITVVFTKKALSADVLAVQRAIFRISGLQSSRRDQAGKSTRVAISGKKEALDKFREELERGILPMNGVRQISFS